MKHFDRILLNFASIRTPIRLTAITMVADALIVVFGPQSGFTAFALGYTHSTAAEAAVMFLFCGILLWRTHSLFSVQAILSTIPLWGYLYLLPTYALLNGLSPMPIVMFLLSTGLLIWALSIEYKTTLRNNVPRTLNNH